MNRMLMLGTLIVACNLAGCATQIDDPLPASFAGDASGDSLRRIDTDQIFPKEEVQHPVPAMPSAPSETLDPTEHLDWNDLLACLSCAAERYKAKASAARVR